MPGIVANAQNPEAGVRIPESHRTELSTSIDIIDHDGNNIGYIQSFSESQNRGVTPVRHLNSEDAGRILEMAPAPANITLAVNGFALYNKQNDGSLIQRLGGSTTAKSMKSLEEQGIPFNIIKRVVNPATQDEVELKVYRDCWLTSFSSPTNIGTALISESANVMCSWIE